jgi:hypothetical protein
MNVNAGLFGELTKLANVTVAQVASIKASIGVKVKQMTNSQHAEPLNAGCVLPTSSIPVDFG